MFKAKFRFTIDGENEKGLVTVFVNKEQYLNAEHETKAIETINEKYWNHPDFNENGVTVDLYDLELI
jgi:hypothetical protein